MPHPPYRFELMLDSFAVQFWLSAGRRVPAQKVPEPSTHVHVELNPPGGDCPTGSTSPSWRNAPKQTKSEPDFPNSEIIRPSTRNCSATELIDPKMHPIARALASCQVQFCFSKYSTISSSLGGHTVGDDVGTGTVGETVGDNVGYGV